MTRRQWQSSGRHNVAVAMAGWLFADLLLVLFLVGIGTQSTARPSPDPVPPPACPPPAPAPVCPSPPPTVPTLAKEPVTISLELRYVDFLASGEARRRAAEDLLEGALEDDHR